MATDAPLLPHQLRRVAKPRTTALTVSMHPNDRLSPLFEATVEASEEAIVNALVAAKTMIGRRGWTVFGLPPDEIRWLVQQYKACAHPPA